MCRFLMFQIHRLSLAISCTLLCLQCGQSQHRSDSGFERWIDSLKTSLPVFESHVFSFDSLAPRQEFHWHEATMLRKVGEEELERYFEVNKVFRWWKGYQTVFYYCLVSTVGGSISVVVVQRIHNDDESNMYLVGFDSTGKPNSVDLLAQISKSPDDFTQVMSWLTNGARVKTLRRFQWESDDQQQSFKDSVLTKYDLGPTGMTNPVLLDSVRTVVQKKVEK